MLISPTCNFHFSESKTLRNQQCNVHISEIDIFMFIIVIGVCENVSFFKTVHFVFESRCRIFDSL